MMSSENERESGVPPPARRIGHTDMQVEYQAGLCKSGMLDKSLPHIVELAENSPDCQIKAHNCKLLHSRMISMIGSSLEGARDTHGPETSPFHKIFLRVFPVLLRLAVDVDQPTRSLYRQLVSQLIHWLNESFQYENPEREALLNACIEAAGDTFAPLRHYGAECLAEFLNSSIKQTSASPSSGSVNVQSLLEQIYNIASHTNPEKRLGASLIVNRIYRVFGEDVSLVNQFTLELLYWMLVSLRLAEGDHAKLGTRQQACLAIMHLKRIIQVNASLFLEDSKDRRRIRGRKDATLDSLVYWLMTETWRKEMEYANMCRALFESFMELLPGSPTPGAWIDTNISKDSTFLISTHGGVDYNSETISQPATYQRWCSRLASTLTNYIWLLNHSGNWDALMAHLKKATVLTASAKFLENCLPFSPDLARGQMATPLMPLERQQIKDQNFVTARKVILFVSLVSSQALDRGHMEVVDHLKASGLLGQRFFSVFASCLFNPNTTGSDELLKGDAETKVLRGELEVGLKAIHRISTDVSRSLGKVFMETISSDDLIPLAVSADIKGKDPIKCKAVVDGLELANECGILESMFEGSSRKAGQYIVSLYETFMAMQTTQDPLWINYCSALLRFSLGDRQCRRRLWQYLLNPQNLDHANTTYFKYADEINRRLALGFADLTPILSRSAKHPLVLTIWNDFLEYMFSHPELSVERNAFLNTLTKDYSALESIVNSLDKDQVSMTIAIWKRLVALSPRILHMSMPFVEYFFKVFRSFFERRAESKEYLTLPVISEAFPILPIFLSYPGARRKEFEVVFDRAIFNLMPMSSSEYKRGTAKFKDYIAALDLLLKALVASSSTSLFKTLMMKIAIREPNHPHRESIQQSISLFALKLPFSKFLDITSYYFGEFIKRAHPDEHRRNIMHQILLPILKVVPPPSISRFLDLHITHIMGVIKQELTRLTDVNPTWDSMERECCYDLIHVLYMRLPAEVVDTKSDFTRREALMGKHLTEETIKTAKTIKFKRDKNSLMPQAVILREKRVACNAFAAVILCIRCDVDIFHRLLFCDNEAENELVWESIVDVKASNHFEAEPPGAVVKSRFSDLRSNSLDHKKMRILELLRDSSMPQLDEGSLHTEIECHLRGQGIDSSAELGSLSDSAKSVSNDQGDDKRDDAQHMIKLDAIDSNPCMKTIMFIVNELHAGMTQQDSSMPSWMMDIHRKMVNPSTALNIRLFLAKIIINMPKTFEMYAGSWIRPLMRLAMEGMSYGQAMNYVVQGLCELIVVWGKSVKLENVREDRLLLLKFLSYLMKNCYHKQEQHFQNNLRLINSVFDNWPNIVIAPTTIIYNNFKNLRDEKKNVAGIRLLGIVLTHDNPPFYEGSEIGVGALREGDFYKVLVRNMSSLVKEVYTSAAEVCGMVLAYMTRHDSLDTDFQKLVTKKLSDLLEEKSRTPEGVRFLTSLHKVQLHFPEITDAFGPELLLLLPQMTGGHRTLALEIIAGRAAFLPNLFRSLQGLNVQGSLRDKELYYSILMVLFDKNADAPAVVDSLRTELLRGVRDRDTSNSIQDMLVKFLAKRM